MFIQSLELFHYLPLMHQGTNRLSIPAFGKINIVTGDNGSGKSSLMRELSPFPSARNDYEKDGYKKITIVHDNHTFEISSNFSRASIHSFIRDGEELNLSGTGDVQTELCRKHFGLSPEIEKLVDGKYKFTEMPKSARKELIMKTYPSSLEFILDYHNAIKSQIRGNNATLRNYNEREAKTKVEMIDESVYMEFIKKQTDYRRISQACDHDLYAIDIKLQELRQELAGYPTSPTLGDLDFETAEFRRKSQQHLKELLWMKTYPTYEKIVEAVRQMQNRVEIARRTIELKEKAIQDLATEADRLNRLLQNDAETEIENYTRQIQAAKERMEENVYDETIFIVHDENFYNKFVQLAPKIREYLEAVGSTNLTRLYSIDDADRIAHERDSESYIARDLANRITIDQKQIESLRYRIEQNSKSASIPPACRFSCGLKQQQEQIVKLLEADVAKLEATIKANQQEYMEHAAVLEGKNKLLESITPYLDIIDYLNRVFTKDIWDDWFLEGLTEHKNFFELNSSQMSLLQSKFAVMLENSRKFIAYSKAAQTVKDLELKISSLKSSSKPAQEAIKELIAMKTKQLDALNAELDTLRQEEQVNEKAFEGTKGCQRLLEDIKTYREHIDIIQRRSLTEFYVDALRTERQWLQDVKHECDLQDLKIQEMIGRQSQLRTCLEHEILPAKEELKARNEKLQILEEVLSPTSGIPHKYISRYLSSIFNIANHILSVCWDYEMSVAYTDEGDIDFSIQLVINSNSEVKDVSLGSLGQKSIVNLSLILAILTYRHYIEQFPLKLDEVDIGLSPLHRSMLVTFLSDFVHSRDCTQVFLISHEAATNTGFSDAKIVSMSSNDLEAGYIGELISKRS